MVCATGKENVGATGKKNVGKITEFVLVAKTMQAFA